MHITSDMISSLLAAVGGALLAFSLVTEARETIRNDGPWRTWPVPIVELASYAVMTFAIAAPLPGLGPLVVASLIVPPMMLAFRALWMLGRRTEGDPIRRALEGLERRREGRDRI